MLTKLTGRIQFYNIRTRRKNSFNNVDKLHSTANEWRLYHGNKFTSLGKGHYKLYVEEEILQECPTCHWHYPDWWLVPMFIGGQGYTTPICGQCALEQGNKVLGVERKEFNGSQAEFNRQNVLEWRRKHPELHLAE